MLFRNTVSPGKGHVGLYRGDSSDGVLVLGANQTLRRGHHGICTKAYGGTGALALESFITPGGTAEERRPPEKGGSHPPPTRPTPDKSDDDGIRQY